MSTPQTTAIAHPNIALVKYWGKQNSHRNRPAVPSLSLTLEALWTRTRIQLKQGLDQDQLILNGKPDRDSELRVSSCLDEFRQLSGHHRFCQIETSNNFPTGAGLASSASGFAALVIAANRVFSLELDQQSLSRIARRHSGSAARSIFGGFAQMPLSAEEETAYPLLAANEWPLTTLIAITSDQKKSVGSTEGMRLSAQTSDYYQAWIDSAEKDYQQAKQAITNRNFQALAKVSERSCLKMHGLMISSDPGLIYWNSATIACLHAVRKLRDQGAQVFFTVDAGPQVKAVCIPEFASEIARTLSKITGVVNVIESGLGKEARIVEEFD